MQQMMKKMPHLESLGDHPGVETLRDVELGLLKELSDEQHGRGGAITSHVIL